MKALVISKYGSPESLTFKEFDVPAPGENEVLVKVRAASVNAADIEWMKGLFLVHFFGSPRNRILGSDMTGVVAAVGSSVCGFLPGDEVLADLYSMGRGAFGEYVCVSEKALSTKPKSLSFEQAATISQAGVLALQGLEAACIKNGSEVLINGAGGGIGSFAVQIAKNRGAVVTGVDRADKFALMRRLGADFCLDYRHQDYTQSGKQFDFILDMNADRRISAYKRALKVSGRLVVAGGKYSVIFRAYMAGAVAKKNKKIGVLMWRTNDKKDIATLIRMVEENRISPAIDKVYPFAQAVDAVQYCWEGSAKGKVVISMDDK